MKKLFNRIFTDTFIQIESEHRAYMAQSASRKFNIRVLIVSVTVCLSLIFIEYFGRDEGLLLKLLRTLHFYGSEGSPQTLTLFGMNHQLSSLAYWVFVILIFYFLIPAVIIRFVFRQKLSDYGFSRGSLFKGYKIYLLFFAVMVPLILLFSMSGDFQYRYPFYRLSAGENLWPFFWIWQLLYFLQFVALEFFFRGFMVHGLKQQFGYYSVFIMTIPYCMIHFGKPMPETIAAIIAGIVLGTLSLKSKTIWMGVLIHYTVAISMDLAALWQKGHWQ